MSSDIQARVIAIIEPRAMGATKPETWTLETKIEELGFDSLDLVEVVMAVEDEFGIEIPDEEAESIQTIGDVVRIASGRAN